MRKRPNWDETWMAVADAIALRSQCTRAAVGAVIVTADNRVASIAYNGPASGLELRGTCGGWCPRAQGKTDLNSDYGACSAIHAEANALIRADFTQIQGGTIYVNRSMCVNCAKMVGNSGISTVIHRVVEDDLHRNPEAVEEYLQQCGLVVIRA